MARHPLLSWSAALTGLIGSFALAHVLSERDQGGDSSPPVASVISRCVPSRMPGAPLSPPMRVRAERPEWSGRAKGVVDRRTKEAAPSDPSLVSAAGRGAELRRLVTCLRAPIDDELESRIAFVLRETRREFERRVATIRELEQGSIRTPESRELRSQAYEEYWLERCRLLSAVLSRPDLIAILGSMTALDPELTLERLGL